MAKALVVVESPAKAKTINKYLGRDFKVIASMGHVRDLPKSKLGVDVEGGFEPEYVVLPDRAEGHQGAQGSREGRRPVFVATDPDREGEAIGWHLAEELGAAKKKVRRLMFNEITKKAILEAVEHPGDIDMRMVDAQQARRVLDRLVGYKISPILWDKVRRGLSAGRVQSVALKLICDREREIEAFVPEEYWHVTARLAGDRAAGVRRAARSRSATAPRRCATRPRRRRCWPTSSARRSSSRRSRRRNGARTPCRRSSRASCSRPRDSRSRRR